MKISIANLHCKDPSKLEISICKILAKIFPQPGVVNPPPCSPPAFRQIDPFGPVSLTIFGPKSLFNFFGGVPGTSLAAKIRSEASRDPPKTSKVEKQNFQFHCRIYLKNRHGASFGRSKGHPWAKKKRDALSWEGPWTHKTRKTPSQESIPDAPKPLHRKKRSFRKS